ncbi:MAG TPA: hypothetical protein VGT41_04805 [Candidatus Babeliales bacterium]|nr:hypothetical protein [Candidatus Babeliales bacterium]
MNIFKQIFLLSALFVFAASISICAANEHDVQVHEAAAQADVDWSDLRVILSALLEGFQHDLAQNDIASNELLGALNAVQEMDEEEVEIVSEDQAIWIEGVRGRQELIAEFRQRLQRSEPALGQLRASMNRTKSLATLLSSRTPQELTNLNLTAEKVARLRAMIDVADGQLSTVVERCMRAQETLLRQSGLLGQQRLQVQAKR